MVYFAYMKFPYIKVFFYSFLFFLLIILVEHTVYADTPHPDFETIGVVQTGPHSARFFGEFDSHGQYSFGGNLPVVWFDYGEEKNDLSQKTIETPRVGGKYTIDQRVFNLNPEKIYYVRTSLRLNGEVSHGKVLSFSLKKIEDTSYPPPHPYTSPSYGGKNTPQEDTDESRIEFQDDGTVKTERERYGMYTLSDFWREIKRSLGWGKSEKEKKVKEEKEQSPVEDKKEPEEFAAFNIKETSSVNGDGSYDTQYRKYYRGNTTQGNIRTFQKRKNVTFVPILPFLIFLLFLTVLIILFYFLRRKRQSHIVRKKFRPLGGESFSSPQGPTSAQNENGKYYIPHEPINRVRDRYK